MIRPVTALEDVRQANPRRGLSGYARFSHRTSWNGFSLQNTVVTLPARNVEGFRASMKKTQNLHMTMATDDRTYKPM